MTLYLQRAYVESVFILGILQVNVNIEVCAGKHINGLHDHDFNPKQQVSVFKMVIWFLVQLQCRVLHRMISQTALLVFIM